MTASGLVRRKPRSQSPFPELDGPPPGLEPPAGAGSAGDAEEAADPGRGHLLVEPVRHHGSLPQGAAPRGLALRLAANRLARQPRRRRVSPGRTAAGWVLRGVPPAQHRTYSADVPPFISALRTDAYMGTYSWPDRSWMAWMTSSVMARRAFPGAVPWYASNVSGLPTRIDT